METVSIVPLWGFDPLPPLIVLGQELRSIDGYRSQVPLMEFPSLGAFVTQAPLHIVEHKVAWRSVHQTYALTSLVGVAMRLESNLNSMKEGANELVSSLRDGPSSGAAEGRLLYAWEGLGDGDIDPADLRDFEAMMARYLRRFPTLSRGRLSLLESVPIAVDEGLRSFGGWLLTRFAPASDAKGNVDWQATNDGRFDERTWNEISSAVALCGNREPSRLSAFLVW